MKNQIFILIAAITFMSAAAAQAEEAGVGAQVGGCVGGVVASRAAMVGLTLATGKNLSSAGEVVAMGASCAGGIAAVRSMSSAEAAEAPSEADLQQSNSEQGE